MKLFTCDHCGSTVYFENAVCENCGHALGFDPRHDALVSLNAENGHWTSPALPGEQFVFCANAVHGACNWLVPVAPGGDVYCAACRHNETIPSIDDPTHLALWQTMERAKKRLFYSLIRLGLPLQTRNEDPVHGLAFRFLADDETAPQRVMTGHESGIITIALIEADDSERERRRTSMGEPYRTLLGHFRHEVGHHFWDILVAGQPIEERFRAVFGDERADYGASLSAHYANGPAPGWPQTHISSYATAHPWEDFAETFAHYLHIIDTVEMAGAFGVKTAPVTGDGVAVLSTPDFDSYRVTNIETLIDHWVPLSILINNLNRTMGLADAYPFVIAPAVVGKLGFINDLVHGAGRPGSAIN